jgi:ABC-type multidrug transport system ATPase subunit
LSGTPAHHRASRARVGFIGHATGLYDDLTARENLIFAARLHGLTDPAARADGLLEAEGLTAVARRPTRAFSRGMAQRLAIARGLIHEPEIVLLDEPFTGLDRRAAARLIERIERLRASGCTLIWVTHDVALAARCSDSAIVLHRGSISFSQSSGPLDVSELEAVYHAVSEGLPT